MCYEVVLGGFEVVWYVLWWFGVFPRSRNSWVEMTSFLDNS